METPATLIVALAVSPVGTFALECPLGQGAEPCIYVHIQCLSPAPPSASPHRSGEEKGHAKAGLTPPHSAPPLPAQATWPCVIPSPPPTQGTRGQKAGAGFALFCSLDSTSLSHHFLPAPVGVQGLRERTDLCSYFLTSFVQSGERILHPASNHPICHPLSGRVSLHVFPLLWWEMFD